LESAGWRTNVRFLGAQPRAALREAMQRARALVFPGEEDFGIVMAEAQACGTPVIAFRRGGASEIVTDGATGIFFNQQTAASLEEGLERFDAERFDPSAIRESALRFSRERFMREFAEFLERVASPAKDIQTQGVESGQEVLTADSTL
jgi:glycosyltransferase involved in cell wall biosynthesis